VQSFLRCLSPSPTQYDLQLSPPAQCKWGLSGMEQSILGFHLWVVEGSCGKFPIPPAPRIA
jgi:hypothetical protein